MAEVAAAPATAPAGEKKRPEKPDVDLFNEQLAKAEKEYQESFARYVSCALTMIQISHTHIYIYIYIHIHTVLRA